MPFRERKVATQPQSYRGRWLRRIFIEDIYPSVEGGVFAVKRIVGENVEVWADVLRHGHAVLGVALLWRPDSGAFRGSGRRSPDHEPHRSGKIGDARKLRTLPDRPLG